MLESLMRSPLVRFLFAGLVLFGLVQALGAFDADGGRKVRPRWVAGCDSGCGWLCTNLWVRWGDARPSERGIAYLDWPRNSRQRPLVARDAHA